MPRPNVGSLPNLSLRIDLDAGSRIGPGKIQLLENIDKFGSISAAGRAMDMSYRRAWLLLDELNHTFHEPVATTAHGGRSGGGASLTPFGKRLVQGYRKMETDAEKAVGAYLSMISDATLTTRRARVPRRSQAK
jgi:molybdate transport system regulatory protein